MANKEEEKLRTELVTGAPAYQESDAVKKAQEMLNQQLAQKPGAYQSQWQTQLNDIMDQIQKREKFTYDLNGDALYKQYKGDAIQNGKMAMMDTMGQAASLTGGYGNSYAQKVGQQAYHSELQKLNDIIPELYQLALSKHQMEGDQLLDQYGMLADQEALDYGRYRDQLGDWQNETDRLQDRYDSERNYDFGLWADGRDFAYQQGRDKIEDERWQAQFDEAKRQWEYANGITSGDSLEGNPGSNPDGNPNDKPGVKNWDNGSYTEDAIIALQNWLGVEADGMFGPTSKAALEKRGYSSLDQVMAEKPWLNDGKVAQLDPVVLQHKPDSFIDDLIWPKDDKYAAIENSIYYKNLLGAVSTAKGAYGNQDYQTRQKAYQESVAAIEDAYQQGKINKEQRATLLGIAIPSGR